MSVPELYRAYWESWERFLLENGSPLPNDIKNQTYWWKFELGRPGVHLAAVIKLKTRPPSDMEGMRVELCFRVDLLGRVEANRLYEVLRSQMSDWERSLGTKLDWDSQAPTGNQRQVAINISCNPRDKNDWPRQHRIVLDWMMQFREHFDTTLV